MSKQRGQATVDDILNGPKPPLVAIMHYGHKTGGEPIFVTPEQKRIIESKTRRHTFGSYLGRTMG